MTAKPTQWRSRTILLTVARRSTVGGDYRSNYCRGILRRCDMVCTNPPFSLIHDYILFMTAQHARFAIIGPLTAATYTGIFDLILEQKLFIRSAGHNISFTRPDGSQQHLGNIVWFQNLRLDYPDSAVSGIAAADINDYRHYDGTDIIDVPTLAKLPLDYAGYMGVPITFLLEWNPAAYDLLGILEHGRGKYFIGNVTIDGHEPFKRLLIRKRSARLACGS